ncbi:MAG TPA: glycoside hydrolase family 15 protein [Terriglobia bacterium]|jgi:GH15 family glucan-1,4-alpha-glucosidase|nr:glycoside hydrolase family 15 protein [Terriglobia bacterium]
MAYPPIEDHGLIGDLHTTALVAMDGSIDWFCLPRFDSPSVFAALLDDTKGGFFKLAPAAPPAARRQFYWPGTNVLVTSFFSPDGAADLIDFMPVLSPRTQLIRCLRVIRGSMAFRVECRPAFNYARDPHQTQVLDAGARFRSADFGIEVAATLPLHQQGSGVVSEFALEEGQTATFVLRMIADGEGDDLAPAREPECLDLLQRTIDYWQAWLSRCNYHGRWREMVHRSALVLELLTYEPSGAVVAAPTCSLPERLGGVRNWDYRYNWIRDSAFTLYGLLRIGLTDEAIRFMGWLKERCGELDPDAALQTVYGIDGRRDLTEETLTHLEGYKGSAPVRIGNGAFVQTQLDIYGALLDAVYLFNKYANPISADFWKDLRRLVDWVCDHWRSVDNGIWEVRGPQQDFVYSRLMCWVAVDRALRLAHQRSFPADRDRWLKCRDEIYQEILDRGWNPQRRSFVQSYGSDNLDAGCLIMPLVFFMSPSDPMMLDTIDAVYRPLRQGGLMDGDRIYRYAAEHTDDGLPGTEGTFNMCTFWLVEALTRAGRADPSRLQEARLIFEKMLGLSNHLGLYSEETGACGEALGNFPQAFTHMGLISAAFNLDRALGNSVLL